MTDRTKKPHSKYARKRRQCNINKEINKLQQVIKADKS
jgi:hypothetical protein